MNEKQPDRNLLQEVTQNKLELFGHMCRLNYGREIKSLVHNHNQSQRHAGYWYYGREAQSRTATQRVD